MSPVSSRSAVLRVTRLRERPNVLVSSMGPQVDLGPQVDREDLETGYQTGYRLLNQADRLGRLSGRSTATVT